MIRNKQKTLQLQRIAIVILTIGVLLYLIQIASPLRLVTDSVRYLAIADSAYTGNGFLFMGEQDQFPLGYPHIILLLLKLGTAKSAVFILINIFSLFLGLHILVTRFTFLTNDSLALYTVVFCTIFSWCTIKHVTIPLTEYVYFLISIITLTFTQYAIKTTNKFLQFSFGGLAILFAFLAISLRSIGVVLLPTIIISYVLSIGRTYELQEWRRAYLKPRLFLFLLPLFGLGSVTLLVLLQTAWFRSQFLQDSGYLWSMMTILSDNGLFSTIHKICLHRLEEITQLILNFPQSKLPLLDGYYLLIGVFCWGLILGGTILLFRYSEPITIYFFCYTAVMFCWPYYDARFWIPVLPFIGLTVLLAIREGLIKLSTSYLHFWKRILLGFAFCYVILGGIALFYSTTLTFSGENFGDLYGGGARASVYNSFFKGIPVNSNSDQSELELQILERFQ